MNMYTRQPYVLEPVSPVLMALCYNIFVALLLHGRRVGIPGSPSAFKSNFGWVLAGSVNSQVKLLHTIRPSFLMFCCRNYGNSKKPLGNTLSPHLRNKKLLCTSRVSTAVPRMVDSSFPLPRKSNPLYGIGRISLSSSFEISYS